MLLYSLIYIVTTLGAWTFLLSTERHSSGRAVYLTDLGSLSNTNPLLAISFACIMLSMGSTSFGGILCKDVRVLCCNGREDVYVGNPRNFI